MFTFAQPPPVDAIFTRQFNQRRLGHTVAVADGIRDQLDRHFLAPQKRRGAMIEDGPCRWREVSGDQQQLPAAVRAFKRGHSAPNVSGNEGS